MIKTKFILPTKSAGDTTITWASEELHTQINDSVTYKSRVYYVDRINFDLDKGEKEVFLRLRYNKS